MEKVTLSFGEKLKDLRMEKGLSAVKLGKILGIRDTTILRWEKGEMLPTIDNLRNICVFFGVTSDYLLGLED